MNANDLDRLLMETEEIVPSSGFVASVMQAVREEAAAPAPIPFPWKWALPGLIVSVALALGLIVPWIFRGVHSGHSMVAAATVTPHTNLLSMVPHAQIATSTVVALEWSGLALLLSFAAVWFSMRIAMVKE
ncbi:MAG: hypothetical protein ACLQMO_10305 [Acidobacteriaceae bacterium]